MRDLTNRQVRLRRRPAGLPSPEDFELTEEAAPVPGASQVLVRTLLLSIDPAMRGWVAEGPNYVKAVPVGGVMRSFGLAEVVQSRNTRFRKHDIVFGLPGWQEWAVLDEQDILWHVDPATAPLSAWLGVLGLNGLTAYVGVVDIGRPKPGETVLVSSAAGSLGGAAGQIARIRGARVVGLTSTEEKRDLCLRVFGFHDCINYRDVPDLGRAGRTEQGQVDRPRRRIRTGLKCSIGTTDCYAHATSRPSSSSYFALCTVLCVSNRTGMETNMSNDDLRAANIALAERVITTCGNLRPQEVREDFAEDAVLALPYAPAGTPKETVGRDQIVAYVSLLGNYIEPGIFVDHAFDTLAGDPGVVVARYSASTRLLTTGSPYENTYITLVTVRDGKVARYEEFFDPINWLIAQGGVVESPQK